jgi:hypothetical protein
LEQIQVSNKTVDVTRSSRTSRNRKLKGAAGANIAILGWGSLLWDARSDFDSQIGPWKYDGPTIPIEFSRVSSTRGKALTLVIDEHNGALCQVAYATSRRKNPDEAIADLRQRERCPLARIGCLFADKVRNPKQSPQTYWAVAAWAKTKSFDMVVWTALASNFEEESCNKKNFTIPNAIEHLQSLDADGKAKAAEYVWRAPAFAMTPLRDVLEAEPWFSKRHKLDPTRVQSERPAPVRGAPSIEIKRARQEYRPTDGIKVLFIAEAPPSDPGRFFYFKRVGTRDGLFLEMMRALYVDARELKAPALRGRKLEYLRRFKADGYYLIDAHDKPMPESATRAKKRRLLSDSLATLTDNVRSLVGVETRVVLISSAVYEVCYAPLKAAGFNVINSEMIDFPSSGRQSYFQRKLSNTGLTPDFGGQASR